MITAEKLRSLFTYSQETGRFSRIVSRSSNANAGEQAGYLDTRGYLRIRIDGTLYSVHRLAWLYMTGEWPTEQIDHINRNKIDNRWANLRAATRCENQRNRRMAANNKIGLKGVRAHRKKWKAAIKIAGKRHHLGVFDCPAAAHFAYIVAADKHFGEFARAS